DGSAFAPWASLPIDQSASSTHELSRASDDAFRLLVEGVRDYAIFMLDPGGFVATWNVGAERIKGYRAEDIIGQHFSRFYPAEDVRAGKCEYELAVADREGRFEDEGWRLRKDGSRFWANVVITALRDPGGKLVGFAKVTRDLTERRRAEEERVRLEAERAARDASERARVSLVTTLRSIGDAVIATDPRGLVTVMNHVAESLTGWSEGDARGRPLGEVFHIVNEHTRALVESPVDKVLESGVIVGLANHTVLVARGGEEIAIDDSGAPIRAGNGPIEGVILVFRDVRDRKAEEARRSFLADASTALGESLDYEVTLRQIAALAVPRLADWCAVDIVEPPDLRPRRLAVAHVDPTKVALALELGAKYPPRPDAPTGVASVLRTGRAELVRDVTDAMLVAACVDDEQLRIARSLGLRSALIVPLIGQEGVLGALTFVRTGHGRHYGQHDVEFAEEVARRCANAIERARLFASEQTARRNADVANRAKDEFLAVLSHELRTPLNSIMGWSKMMASPGFEEKRRTHAIEAVERNAVAMAQLIEDLLDMSRIVSGKMRLDVQAVDLSRIVEAALETVRPAADARDIQVVRALAPGLPRLRGDPARLQQVVWNLLSNAVKFTPRGGTVRAELHPSESESTVEISVADTGDGIAPNFLPYVFDAFRQQEAGTTRKRGGLGLGLAITRQLVELHGGRIEARSEGRGKGSTFTVFLPIPAVARAQCPTPEEASRREHGASLECPPQLQGLRVLVVDDDVDSRDLVEAVLQDCGSVVTTAGSVDEALHVLDHEVPDVLVSDIGMPNRDGFDLIRAVRARPPGAGGDVPAVALTAYARAEDRREMLEAGYSTTVSKPVEPAEIIAVVTRLTRAAS
ncbi:MAG TPA: PAS domain S-box protein, partial [Polyangiaceae bacterium]|nr:PAS domain S-box protein [Polyangiaceae bacterium]